MKVSNRIILKVEQIGTLQLKKLSQNYSEVKKAIKKGNYSKEENQLMLFTASAHAIAIFYRK